MCIIRLSKGPESSHWFPCSFRELRGLQIPKHSRQEWGIKWNKSIFQGEKPTYKIARRMHNLAAISNHIYAIFLYISLWNGYKPNVLFPKTICHGLVFFLSCTTQNKSIRAEICLSWHCCPIYCRRHLWRESVWSEQCVHLEMSPLALVYLSTTRGSLTYIGSYISGAKRTPQTLLENSQVSSGIWAMSWMFGQKGGWMGTPRLFLSLFQMKIATILLPCTRHISCDD